MLEEPLHDAAAILVLHHALCLLRHRLEDEIDGLGRQMLNKLLHDMVAMHVLGASERAALERRSQHHLQLFGARLDGALDHPTTELVPRQAHSVAAQPLHDRPALACARELQEAQHHAVANSVPGECQDMRQGRVEKRRPGRQVGGVKPRKQLAAVLEALSQFSEGLRVLQERAGTCHGTKRLDFHACPGGSRHAAAVYAREAGGVASGRVATIAHAARRRRYPCFAHLLPGGEH
mmetsp:Transcript_67341/g.187907  ORF Transcript_67341/g.187907 Transcript_67341/m.187907 type:complete len:235 (+) Transcript_67341:826-1530(+)